jgi:O-acetylserine/cysteine efflux transporter
MSALDIGGLLLVAVVWGINFAVVKAGLAELPPVFFVAIRFVAVAAVLIPFTRLPRHKLPQLAALSVTLGALHFGPMFIGLRGLDVATAAIAIQLQVPFAAILAALFLGDKLGWRRLLGMATAFAGVAVIAGEPRLDANLVSLFMVVGAALVWAVANIQIKALGDEVDVFALSAWVALFAAPQLFAVSYLLEDGQWTALAAASPLGWFSLAYQVVMVTILGYGIWYWAMRRHPVSQVMPFTLLVPLFGVLSGIVFFDEELTWPMIAGGAATILGVAIIVIRRPRVVAPSTKAGL